MTDQWRNRITGHGEEAPDQLLANPRNWRIHPKAQQDALAAVLDQVGWVQDVIVNQRTGHVVDGHARIALAITRQEPTIPVVYVDLDEAEERLILASLDPLSAMATTDHDAMVASSRLRSWDETSTPQTCCGLGNRHTSSRRPRGRTWANSRPTARSSRDAESSRALEPNSEPQRQRRTATR